MKDKKEKIEYEGFEQGPIRPPSEANSLLIRITRNCPWNRCTFCPVYKKRKFSLRPKEHVIKDIDLVDKHLSKIRELSGDNQNAARQNIQNYAASVEKEELSAMNAAWHWFVFGMESIFLQDANSLIIKPADIIAILTHLKKRFPFVKRITSYARSHTVARIKTETLKEIADAGLNRIHIGLESGSDNVLKAVKKGVTKDIHIKGGRKVVEAGMELSEYVMPGLGGRKFSNEHAIETADALNQINPHFIRLRTLAIPNDVELFGDWSEGSFEKQGDIEITKEILLFIKELSGITSIIKSDHILNLFQELEGKMPDDKDNMVNLLENFLSLSSYDQMMYRIGRRTGVFTQLSDMKEAHLMEKVKDVCNSYNINPENADSVIFEIMKRFV
jgi:hypothetical protein